MDKKIKEEKGRDLAYMKRPGTKLGLFVGQCGREKKSFCNHHKNNLCMLNPRVNS